MVALTAIPDVIDGEEILATWPQAVADWINEHCTTLQAATGAITNSQSQVLGITIPANTLRIGATYRIKAFGIITSSAANAVTMRVRCGAASLTGSVLEDVNPTATTTASADAFTLEAVVTFRTIGATASVMCTMSYMGGGSQPFSNPFRVDATTATVSVDTTVDRILELTAVTAAGTTSVNFLSAFIEQVRP